MDVTYAQINKMNHLISKFLSVYIFKFFPSLTKTLKLYGITLSYYFLVLWTFSLLTTVVSYNMCYKTYFQSKWIFINGCQKKIILCFSTPWIIVLPVWLINSLTLKICVNFFPISLAMCTNKSCEQFILLNFFFFEWAWFCQNWNIKDLFFNRTRSTRFFDIFQVGFSSVII